MRLFVCFGASLPLCWWLIRYSPCPAFVAPALAALYLVHMNYIEIVFAAESHEVDDLDTRTGRADKACVNLRDALPSTIIRPTAMADQPAMCDSHHVT